MSFLPTPPSQKRVSFYSSSNGGNYNGNNNSNSMTSNRSNNVDGTISISEKDLKRLSRYDYRYYVSHIIVYLITLMTAINIAWAPINIDATWHLKKKKILKKLKISFTFHVTLVTLSFYIFRNISHFEKNRSAGGARFTDFIKVRQTVFYFPLYWWIV